MATSEPIVGLRNVLNEVVRTKTGLVGFSMLAFLVGLVLIVPFVAPFDVVSDWKTREAWLDNPRDAAPEWSEMFAGKKLPRSIIMTPCDAPAVPLSMVTAKEPCAHGPWTKYAVRTSLGGNYTFIEMTRKFRFDADVFPSEFSMRVWAAYGLNAPLATVTWIRPDNVNFTLLQVVPAFRAPDPNIYPISLMDQVKQDVRTWAITTFGADDSNLIAPEVTLFAKSGIGMLDPNRAELLKGDYTIKVELVAAGYVGLDAKAIIFGTIFGVAGTDSSRRDLLVGLLWGAPVALAFGSVAAIVIVVLQTVLGALATWYGGWWDEIIQRGADVLLIIPLLPILLLIAIIYSPSIWLTLAVLVALGFVGSTTKVARSIVLQVKEEAYIEAAVSYGASRSRILFRHILPRLLPYTFALIALSVPAFIFLEASLSFLGLGDPLLPTWGSILGQAYTANAAFHNFWWWIAFPAMGIVFATVAFSLLGYSFDKVLNPRLREQ